MKWLIVIVVVIIALLLWQRSASAAGVPKAGEPAPGFSLPDQNGKTRSLADFRSKWLVLYFYPKNDTPGCTTQACAFRDDWHKLSAMGAEVVGVSVDDAASHSRFAAKYSLPFTLLADKSGAVAARYGSIHDLGMVKFAKRNTFLIDPEGRIARVYLSANAARNSRDAIEDLQQLQNR